jgi:protein-S-isoprenylcysteine O-methyltransferase Ste14
VANPSRRAKLPILVLLSRWRVNIGFVAGVVVLLVCGHPALRLVARWVPLMLVGLAIRVWARGHLELRSRLAQSGPYAFVRHPLYVGSFVAGLAFTFMMHDAWIPVVFVATFLLMYVPKAMREEAHLRTLYGAVYDGYAGRVGAVVPRLASIRHRETSPSGFAWPQVMRHREYETWLGAAVACAVLMARAIWFA